MSRRVSDHFCQYGQGHGADRCFRNFLGRGLFIYNARCCGREFLSIIRSNVSLRRELYKHIVL